MLSKATCLFLATPCLILASMMCPTCIPPEDLLAPGYGISLSLDGLSSAIAHHNGTILSVASIAGSEEYRNLMSSTLRLHGTYASRSTALDCLARVWQIESEPWDKDVLKLMDSCASYLMKTIQEAFILPRGPQSFPPLDSTEQMLQSQILSLQPFASMSAEDRAQVTVAIQLPAWFLASPYACSLHRIAEETFGRFAGLESAASSAYTALGYELCRVSQEAYECSGPGRLAVFEYDGYLATASTIKTPLDIFSRLETSYSTLVSNNSVEIAEWINLFINSTSPDIITLAGSAVLSSIFQEAINLSHAANRIEASSSVGVKDLVVKGAAQAAKDAMENHNTDCGEFGECLDIRREADRIAGRYVFRRPSVWPAVNNRHWREDSERTIMPVEDPGHDLIAQLSCEGYETQTKRLFSLSRG